MPPKKSPTQKPTQHLIHHRDGSLWAKGQKQNNLSHGFWQWFRKDGSVMRTGYFTHGIQSGNWTTYDKTGRIVKVTNIKPKTTTKLPKKPTPAKPRRKS